MNEIKKEINLLIEKINKWDVEYFENDSPTVSDQIYDATLRKLVKLEVQYPQYLMPNSPTNKVGSNIINKFNKITHNKKMLSLDKAYTKQDIEKFINNILKTTLNAKEVFYVEPKIDGLSIALQYENGKLIKAITRGDGYIGEDVTDNVLNVINDIPSSINYQNNIEIRGEVFITKSGFQEINSIENKFSNPRNMASGTLRQMDKKIVKSRNLSCFVYEIVSPEFHSINNFNDSLLFLQEEGFKTISKNLLTNNIEEIMEYINEFEKDRETLDFETDGIVIKLNNISYYEKIGFTSKFPKYNIAYKFNDELASTKLIGITISIGRTGMVTYNAQLEPIPLKGTIVSAATLHNFNYIHKLGINVGDDVWIKKAGEIIPKVFSLAKKNNHNEVQKILDCNYCHQKLFDNELETDQFCKNNLCPEINVRKIIHFTSRKGMDISGLGESWIRKFYELGIIQTYSDIYLLNEKTTEIKKISRIGEKSLQNLLLSIENSKQNSLSSTLFAIGINHLGDRNCKLVASEIKSLSNFVDFDFTKLSNIKDIGPITTNTLIEFQSKKENIQDIQKIISLGINPQDQVKIINQNTFFTNNTFVITGKFAMNRHEIKNLIENNGGKVVSTISSKITYLICGSDFGSKKSKADELGIKIIYEEALIELIKQI